LICGNVSQALKEREVELSHHYDKLLSDQLRDQFEMFSNHVKAEIHSRPVDMSIYG
jgi:hypothetical protein